MTMADLFIAEMIREGAGTRKTLERIPADKFDWQPHPKSMSMGRLASHVADMLSWLPAALSVDEYVLDRANRKMFAAATTDELVQQFDANLAKATEYLKDVSDEELARSWRLLMVAQEGSSPKPVMEMSKADLVRMIFLNHVVHHRAQLTVYLRLNDLPVPGLYGPSADEH